MRNSQAFYSLFDGGIPYGNTYTSSSYPVVERNFNGEVYPTSPVSHFLFANVKVDEVSEVPVATLPLIETLNQNELKDGEAVVLKTLHVNYDGTRYKNIALNINDALHQHRLTPYKTRDENPIPYMYGTRGLILDSNFKILCIATATIEYYIECEVSHINILKNHIYINRDVYYREDNVSKFIAKYIQYSSLLHSKTIPTDIHITDDLDKFIYTPVKSEDLLPSNSELNTLASKSFNEYFAIE